MASSEETRLPVAQAERQGNGETDGGPRRKKISGKPTSHSSCPARCPLRPGARNIAPCCRIVALDTEEKMT